MQGTLCLPLTITLSVISRLPVTCLPRHHTSPASPGLGQAMLPTQPLTVQLSLTNTVYDTAQLPDGWTDSSFLHLMGCGGQIGMSQAYSETPQTC